MRDLLIKLWLSETSVGCYYSQRPIVEKTHISWSLKEGYELNTTAKAEENLNALIIRVYDVIREKLLC